jgi:predicted flap endonuclease-1-like 5' DNA nuclease
MDSVLALAIISLIAFVGVLFTAAIYVFTVRPRLLEPEPLSVGFDDQAGDDLLRAEVEKLSAALALHMEQLTASAAGTASGAGEELTGMLGAQADAVKTLTGLLNEQAGALAGLDERLTRQDQKLDRLESKLDSRLGAPPEVDREPVKALIQAQADKLVEIGARLDEWANFRARSDDRMSEHARILAELDRELAAQAQTVRLLDSKVSEHTTMLVTAATERREQAVMLAAAAAEQHEQAAMLATAATERREQAAMLATAATERQEQATLLQRILSQIGQVVPAISKAARAPAHPGQERLTDIKGIGPVYASRLYEAGIQTFRQLAAMTPEEVYPLLKLPEWRLRSADVPDWIEQAEHFASQREKVENLSSE